jgi:prepilin peptidase CpaA
MRPHPVFGMRLMTWIVPIAQLLQILLLLHVAAIDIATRLIHNEICLVVALLGILSQIAGPTHIGESLVGATLLLLLLIGAYSRGWMGGGDVKLLVALAVGLPLAGLTTLVTATAFSGLGLAFAHLALRHLPDPRPAPAGSFLLRRVYAVERWRNVRRAPLPYGAAIACGGVWTILQHGL